MARPLPENIRELLEARVEQSPDKEFLFLESDGRVFTYREFDAETNRAAAMLLALGVTKGERVSLYLTNSAEYLIFYFACFKIGAWAGPVNAHLKPREIEFVVADSESGTIITQPDLYENISEARARVASLRNVIVIEDGARWSLAEPAEKSNQRWGGQERVESLAATHISRGDEAVIIYTSGTTGKPKGVLLTHGNILANAEQIALWLRLTEDDRALMIMPL